MFSSLLSFAFRRYKIKPQLLSGVSNVNMAASNAITNDLAVVSISPLVITTLPPVISTPWDVYYPTGSYLMGEKS